MFSSIIAVFNRSNKQPSAIAYFFSVAIVPLFLFFNMFRKTVCCCLCCCDGSIEVVDGIDVGVPDVTFSAP
jgi:hypothetical protein